MKSEALKDSVAKFIVAPLVGAWIEMQNKSDQRGRPSVAPLVGAWIEIDLSSEMAAKIMSLLL